MKRRNLVVLVGVGLAAIVAAGCAAKPAPVPSGGGSPCSKWAARFDSDFRESLEELERAPQTDFIRWVRNPANWVSFDEELEDCCYFSMQARNVPADGKFSECLLKETGEVVRKTRF